MLVIFLFYVLNLLLMSLEPLVKFVANFYEQFTHYQFHNLHYKLSLAGLIINVPRLVILILFSFWIILVFNFSIFLVFMLMELVVQMLQLIKGFRKMNELTKTMDNLPKATAADLQKVNDKTCMVCFRQMQEGRILPCEHIFHMECLKLWIQKNTNHFCPKCKRPFDFNKQSPAAAQQPRNPPQEAQPNMINPHVDNPADMVRNMQRRMFLQPVFVNQYLKYTDPNNSKSLIDKDNTQRDTEQQRLHRQQFERQQEPQPQNNRQGNQRIGSIAYCLPTEAVLFRRRKDFQARTKIKQFTAALTTTLQFNKKVQMIVIPE